MSDAESNEYAMHLTGIFLDVAGDGLENQLKALRGVVDGYSIVLDKKWTGEVVQSFTCPVTDTLQTVRDENDRLFDELAKLKESAVMLTAVLSRMLSSRRASGEMESPQ